ncbi:MAG: hypothetical protein KBH86_02950 [Syntrophorhabdus sp.]|nr:hypothetical protein [Syntrophorhabdus sp.]
MIVFSINIQYLIGRIRINSYVHIIELNILNGNIIGAVETLHDVTEFKVASDALKKALETHTSILDNTVVIVENSKLVL